MNSGEPNDDELEELEVLERLYAVIHHADDTQQKVEQNSQDHVNSSSVPTITPKSNLRRYWHTGDDHAHVNTQFQKVNYHKSSNVLKHIPPTKNNIVPTPPNKGSNIAPKPKEETPVSFKRQLTSDFESFGSPLTKTKPKEETPVSLKRQITSDLESFGSPLTKGTKTVINICETFEIPSVDLETSDEDEVIEVALPPKPTITIESSDEDEISVIDQQVSKIPEQASKGDQSNKRRTENNSRDDSTSPVPSVVSSVSDDFMRSDCIALKISSRRPDNPSFDFSLHGSDLLGTPSKKKKKKKNKKSTNNVTTTTTGKLPDNVEDDKTVEDFADELFATPKTKVKNKNQKAKTKPVMEKSIPNPDIYDSDSNQSIDNNKKQTYAVTEKSLPCADVYESDSSQPEIVHIPSKPTLQKPDCEQVGSTESTSFVIEEVAQQPAAQPSPISCNETSDSQVQGDGENTSMNASVVDLTDDLEQTVMQKKKKKNKKSTNNVTPTITAKLPDTVEDFADELFATPKTKVKNKNQKAKTKPVMEKSITNPDIYDSDSNQSVDNNKKPTCAVTEKSLPCADVYESDSSQPKIVHIPSKPTLQNPDCEQVGSTESTSFVIEEVAQQPAAKPSSISSSKTSDIQTKGDEENTSMDATVVDLTDDLEQTIMQEDIIEENIFMANVTGFEEFYDYGDVDGTPKDPSKLGSTKVPAILYSNLDFDLNQNEKSKTQCYSLSKLRVEMEKFYNESWGGENFNHREIQKTMSRDKSLWEIDPKDRMPSPYRRKTTCNYCHRVGHRDDTCRMKPPICHMCGSAGHQEPRCPHKICVNCGSPNHMFSTICRNCSNWGRITCAECHQQGHPSSHCPDLWRRYHNTIDNDAPLEQCLGQKKHWQQYCSGCTRRGHLVHTCRLSLPFSGLPINTPYVVRYQPFYPRSQGIQFANENDRTLQNNCSPRVHKRQSKSPAHETPSKKRRESAGDGVENRKGMDKQARSSPQPFSASTPQRMRTQSENTLQKNTVSSQGDFQNTPKPVTGTQDVTVEKAPDYIPIPSVNHDKKGQVIQDNEVSDSSDAVTSARIYITDDAINKLKTEKDWLKETSSKHNVKVDEANLFLSATGRLADIESFQAELREWMNPKKSQPEAKPVDGEDSTYPGETIPKNRNNILRKLSNAFQSLEEHLGDPKELLKELNYLQRKQHMLQNQKVVSAQKLSNGTGHIRKVVQKLNMIFLGQAGLGGGSIHTNKLRSLVQTLTHLRSKAISFELRKTISVHYKSVFTAAVVRSDYPQLLAEYSSKGNNKKKKKKPKQSAPQVRPFPGIQGPYRQTVMKERANNNVLDRLYFYHRRLTNAGSKEGQVLARRIYGLIASFKKTSSLSSKATKKWKKLREQADLFLK